MSITVCPGLPRQLAGALLSLGSNVLENNHKKGSPQSCVFHLHGLCCCCGKLLLAMWQEIRHFLLQTSRQIQSLFSSIASRAILLPLRSHIFVRLVHDIHTCLAFPCSCHPGNLCRPVRLKFLLGQFQQFRPPWFARLPDIPRQSRPAPRRRLL